MCVNVCVRACMCVWYGICEKCVSVSVMCIYDVCVFDMYANMCVFVCVHVPVGTHASHIYGLDFQVVMSSQPEC